jgi:hypothetical protein
MDINSVLSMAALIVSIISMMMGIINHKKIKSKCFGHDLGETSLDITSTTPEPKIVATQ